MEDTRACLYTPAEEDKLLILEKAGIFEGLKSRTQTGGLNLDRKGSFPRDNIREEKRIWCTSQCIFKFGGCLSSIFSMMIKQDYYLRVSKVEAEK